MKNWFKESEVFYEENSDKFSLGSQIQKAPESILRTGISIVLIGINETIADAIRRELYKTSYVFQNIYFADLGNVRNENSEFIIPILKELAADKLNIILLGSTQDQFESRIKAFDNSFLNLAFIEKAGDFLFSEKIQKLVKNSSSIYKAKLLGYQSHLFNHARLNDKLFNHSMRLGKYRNNYKEIEPVLRDVDFAIFNMDSIRYSEVPGIKNTSPSGLTSEEACQIMKYIGLNSKENMIDIIGYDPKFDFHNQGAMMVSQLIWYYIEGLDQQVEDDLTDHTQITSYVVEASDYNLSLNFFQSKKTGRWWIEIPKEDNESNYYLPCSEDDYRKATRNELSDKIFNELSS